MLEFQSYKRGTWILVLCSLSLNRKGLGSKGLVMLWTIHTSHKSRTTAAREGRKQKGTNPSSSRPFLESNWLLGLPREFQAHITPFVENIPGWPTDAIKIARLVAFSLRMRVPSQTADLLIGREDTTMGQSIQTILKNYVYLKLTHHT